MSLALALEEPYQRDALSLAAEFLLLAETAHRDALLQRRKAYDEFLVADQMTRMAATAVLRAQRAVTRAATEVVAGSADRSTTQAR